MDTETRQLFLSLYNIVKHHLVITNRLERIVDRLLEENSALKAEIENADAQEREAMHRNDAPLPQNTNELLIRVQHTIQQLGDHR